MPAPPSSRSSGPAGDFARAYDANVKGQSSYFVWLNRGKKSVVIDVASDQGRAQLEALIATADVLLQNLKPGALEQAGLFARAAAQGLPKTDHVLDQRLRR